MEGVGVKDSLFHIMLKKLPIMLFSNAPKCCSYYATDCYPIFHVML